jgi:hypothetical protein
MRYKKINNYNNYASINTFVHSYVVIDSITLKIAAQTIAIFQFLSAT